MLANPDKQANIINQWIHGITQFDFTLAHVPAYRHQGPDALSRRPITEEVYSGESDPEQWIDEIALLAQLQDTPEPQPRIDLQQDPPVQKDDTYLMDFMDPDPVKEEPKVSLAGRHASHQDKEEELTSILQYLVTQQDPQFHNSQALERFKHKASQYFMKGTHMYRQRTGSPPQVVIFNPKHCRGILWEMHEGNAHHGVWAVVKQIILRYHWPNIQEEVKQHIQSCHTCQLCSTKKKHQPITSSHPP